MSPFALIDYGRPLIGNLVVGELQKKPIRWCISRVALETSSGSNLGSWFETWMRHSGAVLIEPCAGIFFRALKDFEKRCSELSRLAVAEFDVLLLCDDLGSRQQSACPTDRARLCVFLKALSFSHIMSVAF
jgi:hypothetical protein